MVSELLFIEICQVIVSLAKDCYTIGREAYLAKNWKMSRDWMKEALNKYDEGSVIEFQSKNMDNFTGSGPGYSDVDLTLVYDHLSFSEYQLGNVKRAAQYTRDLLQNGEKCWL